MPDLKRFVKKKMLTFGVKLPKIMSKGGLMGKLPTELSAWVRLKIKKSETQKAFFDRVVNEEKLASDFVAFITKNPRLNKPTYRALSTIIAPVQWRLWQKKYAEAYDAFVHQKWRKARRIEDVLRIVPNFSPWALKDRFGTITLGKVPADFGESKDYLKLLEKIRASKVVQEYKKIKALENNLKEFAAAYPEVKKIDWFNMNERTHFLSKLLHQATARPFTVQNAHHKYIVRFLCNPFSCKMVFEVAVKKQKYILKMVGL